MSGNSSSTRLPNPCNIDIDAMMQRIRRIAAKKLCFTDGCLAATPQSRPARTTPQTTPRVTPRTTPQRTAPRMRHIPFTDLRVNRPKTKHRRASSSSSVSKIYQNFQAMKSTIPSDFQESSTDFRAVERQDHHYVCKCKLSSEHHKRAPAVSSPVYNKKPIPIVVNKPRRLPSKQLLSSHHEVHLCKMPSVHDKREPADTSAVYTIEPIPTVVNKPRPLPSKELLDSHHQVKHSVHLSESPLENRRRAIALLSSAACDMRLKPTGVTRPSPIPIVKILGVHHKRDQSVSLSEEQTNKKSTAGAPLDSSSKDTTPKATSVKPPSPIPIVKILGVQHKRDQSVSLSEEQTNKKSTAGAPLDSSTNDTTPKATAVKRPSPIPIVNLLNVHHKHGDSVSPSEARPNNKRKAGATLDSSASDVTPEPMNDKRRRITPLASPSDDMMPTPTRVQKIQRPPRGVLVYKLEDDHSVCLTEPRPFWMRI